MSIDLNLPEWAQIFCAIAVVVLTVLAVLSGYVALVSPSLSPATPTSIFAAAMAWISIALMVWGVYSAVADSLGETGVGKFIVAGLASATLLLIAACIAPNFSTQRTPWAWFGGILGIAALVFTVS